MSQNTQMPHLMSRFRWWFTLIYVLCTPVSFAIPLRILAWDDGIAARNLEIVCTKGTFKLEGLHPLQRSRIFDVSVQADAPALIFAKDRLGPEGKPAQLVVKIPAGIKNPLMLLLPDEKAASGLRQLVIEDSTSDFNWGTIRLVNTSGKPMVFGWDKKRVMVPDGWEPVNVAPGGKARNMGAVLYLADNPEKPIYSAIWEHRDLLRQLVFIVPSEDLSRGAVDFKFIIEDQQEVKSKDTKEE